MESDKLIGLVLGCITLFAAFAKGFDSWLKVKFWKEEVTRLRNWMDKFSEK